MIPKAALAEPVAHTWCPLPVAPGDWQIAKFVFTIGGSLLTALGTLLGVLIAYFNYTKK